jgi:protein-S-isoprenylcysteine O-methyltransferase Ste14
VPELALVLWIVYTLVALVLRVLLQLRRTGRTGLVVMRARPGSAEWAGEVLELVAFALAVGGAVLGAGGRAGQVDGLDAAGPAIVGAALFVAGVALIVVSQEAMGRSWRIGIDRVARTELVTTGPFSRVRNPIFTSLVVVLAGNALLVGNVITLAAVAVMVLSVQLQARREEDHLLALHGGAYASYAERVGRFLPGVGRLRAGRPSTTRS